MDISQLMNDGGGRVDSRGGGPDQSPLTSLGVLTKTLAQTPVIRWILPARIRHKDKMDVAFIGEDFVEIKEIDRDGHLTHIATKANFDGRILSAKVLGPPMSPSDEVGHDRDIKIEDHDMSDGSHPESARLPPQCLVLALDKQQLIFMFACEDDQGLVNFELSTTVPLPASACPMQQLGRHLAVDPKSRAMAVAAAQDNVLLYSTEPMGGLVPRGSGFLPISRELPLTGVLGTIHNMEFLYPPDDDPYHVVLLLVVIKDSKTTLVQVDWSYSQGIQYAQSHNPLPISKGLPLPNLLIPIQSSGAFIMSFGSTLRVYTGILAGNVQAALSITLPDSDPKLPGSSPLLPRWVAWARPMRNRGKDDYLYLAREDGDVFYIVLSPANQAWCVSANCIHNFDCHIDSAFACYGHPDFHADFFAIGADSSVGGVYSVLPIAYNAENTGSRLISISPNWSRTYDLIASKLPRNSDGTSRSRDALFVPSGRQPYGRISELRHGVEARSGFRFADDVLSGAIQLWTLPSRQGGALLVLLTSPRDSRLYGIAIDDLENPSIDAPRLLSVSSMNEHYRLDYASRTVAAAVVADDYIMQITEGGISMSCAHGSPLRQDCPPNARITVAAIDEEHSIAVTVLRHRESSFIRLLHIVSEDGEEPTLRDIGSPVYSDKDFVSISVYKCLAGLVLVLGDSNSSLLFYSLSPQHGPIPILEHTIRGRSDTVAVCGDIVVMSDHKQVVSASPQHVMLLCGLRDGTLYGLELSIGQDETLQEISTQHKSIGLTSIKLDSDASSRSDRKGIHDGLSAYATCGSGFCKIEWKGAGSKELQVSDIWVTDIGEPLLQQGAVTAFAMTPNLDFLGDLAKCLILTSGTEAFITRLDIGPKVVPRSIPIRGTPNRMIYSHSYGCFITVAAETSVHPSQIRRGSQSRSIRYIVEFTSVGIRSWKHIHYMEPGTRVHSIVEWNYKDAKGKRYSSILLGSGPNDPDAPTKGEITHLTPKLRDGTVNEVHAKRVKILDAAVYSLVPYGDRGGLVACTDSWVYLFEYQPTDSKFMEVCKCRTDSPGVHITAAPPLIYISTKTDSLMTFRYETEPKRLEPIGLDYRGRDTMHHVSLSIPPPSASNSSHPSTHANLSLLSTQDGFLVGQTAPPPTAHTMTKTVITLFSASLRRSLMRIRQANIRPPWKTCTVPGVLEDGLVGTTVDGTVLGLAILDPGLASRLRWLQRLCERNAGVCPMAPSHLVLDEEEDGGVVLPPRGFEGLAGGAVRAVVTDPEDMHVDGDVLQRLLIKGGAPFLVKMLELERAKKDRIGSWVRRNFDAQVAMVEPLMEEVKLVLDRWW